MDGDLTRTGFHNDISNIDLGYIQFKRCKTENDRLNPFSMHLSMKMDFDEFS